MGEIVLSYLDQIILISGNLLVILKMISTLKSNVKATLTQVRKDFSVLKQENITLAHALDKVLEYIEMESDLKGMHKLIPQEVKDKYVELKTSTLEVHNEVKRLG